MHSSAYCVDTSTLYFGAFEAKTWAPSSEDIEFHLDSEVFLSPLSETTSNLQGLVLEVNFTCRILAFFFQRVDSIFFDLSLPFHYDDL